MTNIILNAIKSPPGTPGPLKEVWKKKSIVNLKRKWEKKVDERTNDLKKDRKKELADINEKNKTSITGRHLGELWQNY